MKTIIMITLFVFFLIGSGCEKEKEQIMINKIISVTDFSFTLGDKEAVSIIIGKDQNNFFDITIQRDNVFEGFSVNSTRKNKYQVISADGNWNGKQYIQSKHDTYIHFSIDKIDKENKIAIISIAGKFIESGRLTELLELSKNTFQINGKQFENLVSK